MMDEDDLLSIVDAMELTSVGHSDSFIADNQEAFKRFMGELYGDEQPNRSKVVSTDVADVVEADMPSLARVFLGAGEILEFIPTTEKPDDIKEAEHKNKYIPYLIRNCKDSFKKQHDWLKAIEIYKAGVLEYGLETREYVKKKKWRGLTGIELAEYLDEFEQDAEVKELKIVSQDSYKKENEIGEMEEHFDIEVSLICETQEYFLNNVPIEDLILSRNAQTKEDADIVGKRWVKTRGELIEEGFDKEQVKKLKRSQHTTGQQLKDDRFRGQGGNRQQSEDLQTSDRTEQHWTMELVAGIDVYAKVDYDDDGIRERRHIIKSGREILLNEDFDHVPYAICSAILMPHNIIGRSRAEITMPTQKVQTVLSRAVCDNVYLANAGRNIVSNKIKIEDMLAIRENGIVRYSGEDPVTNHVMPLITPYVGDRTLQVIQYFDSKRAQTTGSLMASQGLEADDLHKETATRFRGVEDASKAKVELLARVIAETGYKHLYEGFAWFAQHYQDDEKEIDVLGEQLKVNPKKWKYDHACEAQVGTGAGDDAQALQNYSSLLALQEQLKARGSLLVDEKKIYNTVRKIAKTMGIKDVTTVINNPEVPEQMLLAQNEQLQMMVMQLQQMMEMQQNPLAEAENIKAMKEITIKQQQMQNDNAQWIREFAEKQRQFEIKRRDDMQKHQDNVALDITDLEVKSKKDYQGGLRHA